MSSQRNLANERDIQKRIEELEKTLGSVLPKESTSSARIEEIVRKAEEEHVKASILERNADIDRNPVYTATAKRKANLFV